jgi:hypothetical protein
MRTPRKKKLRARQLVTVMARVRVRGNAELGEPAEIRLEAVDREKGWGIPGRSSLRGILCFPVRPEDDGLILPVEMWICDLDDHDPLPPADEAKALLALAEARRARAAGTT